MYFISSTVPARTIIPSSIIHGNVVTIESKGVMSINAAAILFIKCTVIGIRMLSVFRYSMHMHNPNRNALTIPPKSWPMENRKEDIIIAGIIPILIFSLLNRTPRKISSSRIGAKMIDAIVLNINAPGVRLTESMSIMLTHVGSSIPKIMSSVATENRNR